MNPILWCRAIALAILFVCVSGFNTSQTSEHARRLQLGPTQGQIAKTGLCGVIKNAIQNLPGSCSVTPGCVGFKCTFTLFGIGVEYHAALNFCARPVGFNIGVSVPSIPMLKYSKSLFQEEYKSTSPVSIKERIPGLSFQIAGVPGVPGAGIVTAFAQITASVTVSTWDLEISIGIDACADVAGKNVCGSGLTDKLPLSIWSVSENLLSVCKSSPPAGTPGKTPGVFFDPIASYYGNPYKSQGCGAHQQEAVTCRVGSVYENSWCRPRPGCNPAKNIFCPQPLNTDMVAGCYALPTQPQTGKTDHSPTMNQCGLRCESNAGLQTFVGTSFE